VPPHGPMWLGKDFTFFLQTFSILLQTHICTNSPKVNASGTTLIMAEAQKCVNPLYKKLSSKCVSFKCLKSLVNKDKLEYKLAKESNNLILKIF